MLTEKMKVMHIDLKCKCAHNKRGLLKCTYASLHKEDTLMQVFINASFW